MRSPRSVPGVLGLRLVVVCLALSSASLVAACSQAEGSGDTSLVVEVLQDEITLENKTGASLSKGEVTIMPMGIARPYAANIAYMTNGSKRSFPFNTFRMSDGSKFARDVAKGKSVKVTARDAMGKTYEREVPFK